MYYPKDVRDIALTAKFMTTQSAGNILSTVPPNSLSTQFAVGSVSIQNRSGNAAVVGIGGRLPISLWRAGQWDESATTYADDTTDAQDAGANDFALTTTTNNDGCVILCRVPFNIISIVVGTSSGGTPAYDLAYSQSGGWATISNALVAPAFASTGEQLVWFNVPNDWIVANVTDHGTGIPVDGSGWYGLRIRATTAPTTAPLATLLIVGRMYYATEAVADNATYLRAEDEGEFPILPQCDALCAAISDATGGQSRATATFRLKG